MEPDGGGQGVYEFFSFDEFREKLEQARYDEALDMVLEFSAEMDVSEEVSDDVWLEVSECVADVFTPSTDLGAKFMALPEDKRHDAWWSLVRIAEEAGEKGHTFGFEMAFAFAIASGWEDCISECICEVTEGPTYMEADEIAWAMEHAMEEDLSDRFLNLPRGTQKKVWHLLFPFVVEVLRYWRRAEGFEAIEILMDYALAYGWEEEVLKALRVASENGWWYQIDRAIYFLFKRVPPSFYYKLFVRLPQEKKNRLWEKILPYVAQAHLHSVKDMFYSTGLEAMLEYQGIEYREMPPHAWNKLPEVLKDSARADFVKALVEFSPAVLRSPDKFSPKEYSWLVWWAFVFHGVPVEELATVLLEVADAFPEHLKCIYQQASTERPELIPVIVQLVSQGDRSCGL